MSGFRKWNGSISTAPANDDWKPLGARDEENDGKKVSQYRPPQNNAPGARTEESSTAVKKSLTARKEVPRQPDGPEEVDEWYWAALLGDKM